MPAIRVRVVGDPGGDHPEWVRQAWLGVEFDAFPQRGHSLRGINEMSRSTVTMDEPWAVNVRDALQALEDAGQDDAVAWWRSRGYPNNGKEWLFEFSSCVPVTEQETVPPTLH